MGERLSGDGIPVRHRHGHPDGAWSGPRDTDDPAALETALAAAIRADRLDPEAEQRALAAFRAAAHGTGARLPRSRRRDDWRPPAQRRFRRPARMTFGVVFASLTLGGVAVAAIGSVGSSTDGTGTGRETVRPSATRPGGPASPASSGRPGPADRPSAAQDTEAQCRAYEQTGERGRALDATAWQRLVAAAGGKDKVSGYCAEELARATAAPSGPAGTGGSGKPAAGAGNGTSANAGAPANGGTGTSGTNPGSTSGAGGNSRTTGGDGQAGDGGTGSGGTSGTSGSGTGTSGADTGGASGGTAGGTTGGTTGGKRP
ncbi:hypothetical protein [Streptomyces sp. NPDC013455]|uniref:hypothetical protein n=1 Tax=Streptomyces sp. NPDC013455 TaxID=3155605 RepID=UPI0033D9D3F7